MRTICLIFISVCFWLQLSAQKNKCYLYIYENDCNTCSAGVTHLTEVAIGLEPTVVFGNMSREEAEMGAFEILHLDKLGIPYLISDSLKKIITKTAKTQVSTLAIFNEKGKIVFHCDIKEIQKYIDKINQFATYSFKEEKVIIPKKEMTANFGYTSLHLSDSILGVQDKLTNFTFYSTNTWKKKCSLNIKDISVAHLYQIYYNDTIYLPNYMREVDFYKKHNLPVLELSQNFNVINDTLFILLKMTVPQKTIIINGEPETVIGNIKFLCQLNLKTQNTKFYPVYTVRDKDTVSIELDETFIIQGNELYLPVYTYNYEKQNYFLARFQRNEHYVTYQELLPITIPAHLIEQKKKVKDIHVTMNRSVINRLIYFNYSNQLYDMSTKKWHTLPFENGEPSYSIDKGFSTNHATSTMSVYKGKIYTVVRNYESIYYVIIDKNLKIETKVKLPPMVKIKSNLILYKGRIYYINQNNEFVEKI